MTTSPTWRARLGAALLDNLGLKLFSVLVALGFYAFIHGAQNAQKTVAVSVVSLLPPASANRALMTVLPTDVRVTLRGSQTQLNDLRSDDLGTLQLNLRSGRETHIELEKSMLRVPPGLEIESILPPAIELKWDDVVTLAVPVQVSRTGEPAGGFIVKATLGVEPRQLQATGPSEIVKTLQFARVAPFDVTGLTEGTYRRTLAVDRPPKMIEYDVDAVQVTAEITRELVSKTFLRVPVLVVGSARAQTSPASVDVVVHGPPEVVNSLRADHLLPKVDLRAAGVDVAKPSTDLLPVAVVVERAEVQVRPARVHVKW